MDLPTPAPLPSSEDEDHGSPEGGTGRHRASWWRSALAGLLAAGTSLAIGELIAGFSKELTSPVIAVGNRFVERVPGSLKDFAIEQFGTNDKKVLLAGMYTVIALLGLVFGFLAGRRFVIGAIGIGLFGVVGAWAAGQEVGAPTWAGLPSLLGAVAGIATLAVLLATIAHASHPGLVAPVARASGNEQPAPTDGALLRRSFLKSGGAVLVLASGIASIGRALQGRFGAAASRSEVVLPAVTGDAAAPKMAKAVENGLEGMRPFITPNDDFYRIDVNLTVPQLPADDWTLKIKGMVDEELEFTYEDILAMDLVEERITMTCVSNEIGGSLVGTATWLGVPLKALLDRAGIQEGADQIVGRAFDGFTTGFPVKTLDDDRPAMLAVGMNGEPLPLEHGFPARVIVPGLYGFVSATKWITEIEITTFADFDQYWVERDWAAEGPIKTMSRIDTPKGLSRVSPGPVAVGGVAWAQTRGIEKVEVRVDDGEWEEAKLADEDSLITWRQWSYTFEAQPGARHNISVRATDGEGDVQTEEKAKPFPDGASGLHNLVILVEDE